jgi:hypothetical protein
MIKLPQSVFACVGLVALLAFPVPATANPFYAAARRDLRQLVSLPPATLTDAEKDSLVWLLGSGGADDLGRQSLATLEAHVDGFLPIFRLAQAYPRQPSLRLQRLIRRYGSAQDPDAMRGFLRKWLTEPPDSIYSRTRGSLVRASECAALELQVIAAEALVEYADPMADSLIAALLQSAGQGCSDCDHKSPDKRFLETARSRLAGNALGSIMAEVGSDSVRFMRDLGMVSRAQLCASRSSTGVTLQEIPLEPLRPVLACLRSTLRAPGHATHTPADFDSTDTIVTLYFEDGLTATLAPFDGNRVQYVDDSYCRGVHVEILDAELNAALRQLPDEVQSSTRVRAPRAAREDP